jgi:putative ABC transport system permease protein
MLGAVIGLIGGYIMSVVISSIGIPMPIAPGTTMQWISHIEFVPMDYVLTALLVIIAALVSTYYPARKAAKLDIAEALRHNV